MCFYAKIKAENQFPNPDKVNLAHKWTGQQVTVYDFQSPSE